MLAITGKLRTLKKSKEVYLGTIVCLLFFLFALSLFKNISYPLFWADESMTVMGGVRVLQFGYPKVHDGKNVFYDLNHTNISLGIDEKTDAYIGGASWGQYYFAALGIKLAEMTDDFYARTAIIRTTFAFVGLAGLLVLAFLGRLFFHTGLSKTGYLALFAFFELISISLVLHLREARYYSLTIFLIASCIAVYTRNRILRTGSYRTYAVLLIVILFFVFMTFTPVYFICFVTIFIFESMLTTKNLLSQHSGKRNKTDSPALPLKGIAGDYFMALLPALISLVLILPFLFFFRTFSIAQEMAAYNEMLTGLSKRDMYISNLSFIWSYFSQFDFIYLAIALKLVLLVCFALKKMNKAEFSPDISKATFSLFLTVLFVVYSVAISKIPNFFFTRYLITLQPILALIVIVDAATIYNFFFQWRPALSLYCRRALIVMFAGFVFFNISSNIGDIEDHVYELANQYKGPLDYVIPFIKDRYKNTDKLVIATNYEETSFMYYLDAKAIIGYVGNNLEADSQECPDIIVYREGWDVFLEQFIRLKMKYQYARVTFPIVKSPVNNIPELNWAPPYVHRFRTEAAQDQGSKMDILLLRR